MKNIITITFFFTGLIFLSCNKVNSNEEVLKPETKGYASNELIFPDEGITNIDGILHFNTTDAFFKAIDYLTAPEANIEKFDKKYDFSSLATRIQNTMDEIGEIKDEQLRMAITRNYSNLVEYLGEGVFVPAIGGRGYTLIANPDGVYYVKGVKYTITPENLIVEFPDAENNPNRVTQVLEYKMPLSLAENVKTRGIFPTKIEKLYYDECYTTSDRKVFCRVRIIAYLVYEYNTPYSGYALYQYRVSVQMSAQKKNLLWWDSYQTNFTLQGLQFKTTTQEYPYDVTIHGPATYTHSGDVNNFYVEIYIWGTGVEEWIGGLLYYPVVFPIFNSLQLRAVSRGTSPCGAVINHNVLPAFNNCP